LFEHVIHCLSIPEGLCPCVSCISPKSTKIASGSSVVYTTQFDPILLLFIEARFLSNCGQNTELNWQKNNGIKIA
jgi:hypothetical protein